MKHIIYAFLLLNVSCFRFRIQELSPSLVTQIPLGTGLQEVQAKKVNKAFANLPLSTPIISDKIYIPDYESSLIKVFNTNSDMEYIIGNPELQEVNAKKYRILFHRFSAIGNITVDESDDLYIQNILSDKKMDPVEEEDLYSKKTGEFKIKEVDIAPSYILHIDKQGKMKNIIGLKGANTEPFRYIESIYSSRNSRLFVHHRYAAQMYLSFFHDGKLIGEISENSLSIYHSKEKEEFKIKLDTMIPHRSGKYALISASYYSLKQNRFKFKRIYKVQLDNKETDKLLIEIKNPGEILFSVNNDESFFIWETEDSGESIKLQVHDKQGNHLSNKRLRFPPPIRNWRETFLDNKDQIYSLKLNTGYLELYKWN